MLVPDHSAQKPKSSGVNPASLPTDVADVVISTLVSYALMVGWERASGKHLSQAACLYQRPYQVEQAAPLLAKAFQLLAIDGPAPRNVMDFVRSVDQLGFDESQADEPSAEFRELLKIFIDERSCRDFTISLEHRRALSDLAQDLGRSFEELASLGARRPPSTFSGPSFNTLVNCLTLLENLPLLVVNQATGHGNSRGPLTATTRSIAMAIVLELAACDPTRWETLTSTCLRRLRNFNCPGHTDLENQLRDTLRLCRDRATETFSALYTWCEDYARRESALTLIRSIPDVEDVDPIYREYIDIPNPYTLTFAGPLTTSGEVALMCTLVHPWAHFELSMPARPELGTFSWLMDSQGEIRHGGEISWIPFSEVDFGITPEVFDTLAARLGRVALIRLQQLGTFIEDNSNILTKEMPPGSKILIVQEAGNECVLGLSGAEDVASRCSVRTLVTETAPAAHDEEIEVDTSSLVDEDSSPDVGTKKDSIDGAFRKFGRPTFSQLLGVLKEFGVEFRTTKGSSHRQLWRDGHHYTASPNVYGDVFKLYPSWVQRILARLQIPEDEFLERFCR
jgi:hypothetical protein